MHKPPNSREAVSRRTWLKRVAIAAMIAPGGINGLIRDALAKGNAPISSGINSLRGDVSINGQPARIGMLVKPGDTLHTGPDAEAIYVIGQDAFLQRGNSTVSFGAEATKQLMRVVTGKILSVFGKSAQRDIIVSTATLGIRGTGCYIEDEPGTHVKVGADGTAVEGAQGSRTYFCLCYGSVEVLPTAAPQEFTRYATSHHDHPLYIYDDVRMPTMMVAAPVANHTDAELTLLEALVGRRTPFHGNEGNYSKP